MAAKYSLSLVHTRNAVAARLERAATFQSLPRVGFRSTNVCNCPNLSPVLGSLFGRRSPYNGQCCQRRPNHNPNEAEYSQACGVGLYGRSTVCFTTVLALGLRDSGGQGQDATSTLCCLELSSKGLVDREICAHARIALLSHCSQ